MISTNHHDIDDFQLPVTSTSDPPRNFDPSPLCAGGNRSFLLAVQLNIEVIVDWKGNVIRKHNISLVWKGKHDEDESN
ncbi:hypothetical protein EYC84_005987 [Monilinia fructicola]|uniref:Uncharacterized protein n=1 Tax=Monilinia fructicola TaxID=38448 RepID=A0A5M9K6U7_MONFR|nr:hypothetical protein EYC84_005987 [Monilinia fructicola]